jgi:hypothetical protein
MSTRPKPPPYPKPPRPPPEPPRPQPGVSMLRSIPSATRAFDRLDQLGAGFAAARPDGVLAVAVGVDMRHGACHAAPRSRRFGNATM